MSASTHTIAIAGASAAGVTAAEELRSLGHDGRIVLVEAEDGHPYSKPPLSKAILAGSEQPEDARLPDLDHLGLDYVRGVRITGLDTERQRLLVDGDDAVPYDGLIIATGARARTLRDLRSSDVPLEREHLIRTMADAVWLRDRLTVTDSLLVVGGGILGMEVASTAVKRGVSVTVIDLVPPLLAHCGPDISALVEKCARTSGVDFVLAPGGARLVDVDGNTAVSANGKIFQADTVVSAVGCMPNVEWLDGSGLELQGGLLVDDRCRAASNITAAGDVAAFGSPARRTPHWSNALDQARVAARTLLVGDASEPYAPRPFFWTDQFGLAIKMAGAGPVVDAPTVLDGSLDDNSVLLQWADNGNPHRAATINKRLSLAKLHRYAGNVPTSSGV
ncbi:NAD(P)/FAD-dependent oxidoreductase [Rhodococcus ruber]|uniref:NAD(P)/FAD-dependent oxidoreductase n=1 Tax=Rhodococcus ruber TaxID=1830 RepID=A0ABT4ML85_9NOCA|nr:NAD(P)/FAD-dependent oxidoreductase [Rhodococcus ruber]MCZ4521759.1 NAD(P)/FAD-dependent oxidoreductase [Rhodococcus ruber]